MPGYVHSDRGPSFISNELKEYLNKMGVATSRSTPYHPIGNSQVERYNGIIWRTIVLKLRTHNLPNSCWEMVLCDALHSVRSLLCTATNVTPHERFFGFDRRSTQGSTLPMWLVTPGKVLLRRFVRDSKYEPLVDEVQLLEANPAYARIRHGDGRESTVSLNDLAPCPRDTNENCLVPRESQASLPNSITPPINESSSSNDVNTSVTNDNRIMADSSELVEVETPDPNLQSQETVRRSNRERRVVPPIRFGDVQI